MSFYAYIYLDPTRDYQPFYVGKGCKDRAKKHLQVKKAVHWCNRVFMKRIEEIRSSGQEPYVVILETSNEVISLELERGLINLIGREDRKRGPLLNLRDGMENPSKILDSPHTDKELMANYWKEFVAKDVEFT